jgi:Ran GTPase-activating protein (RanGAP) involved in mRNA processing and transport
METQLKVTSYAVSFRTLLNDRANLKGIAQQLIAVLLRSHQELMLNDMANRGIEPKTVAIRHDLKAAMFTELRKVCALKEETDR